MIQELETRYGTMFVPDTDRGQYWWLLSIRASPEDEFIALACKLLSESPNKGTVIDVGANFGCWSIPLAQYAEEVIAFEPQACCADLLKRSIEANGISNVYVRNEAAGSNHGVVAISQLDINTSGNFGGVSIVRDEYPDAPKALVSMQPLDALEIRFPVTFIKIDVEGGEIEVLRGATKLIEKYRPIMFMEIDHPAGDVPAIDEFLDRHNYAYDTYQGNYLCMPL